MVTTVGGLQSMIGNMNNKKDMDSKEAFTRSALRPHEGQDDYVKKIINQS
jgi:hypothetical protein